MLMLLAVAGCATRSSAPVIDRTGSSARPATPPSPPVAATVSVRGVDAGPDTYTVKRGDTLYGIALDHGLDYRELAQWNKLDNPNVIRAGQELRVRDPAAPANADATSPVSGVQTRPLSIAGSVASRPLGSVSDRSTETVKNEPRAVKLPYTDENLALLSREPKPAPPASSPAIGQAQDLKPLTELKPGALQPKPAPPQAPAVKPPVESEDDEKVEWGWPTVGRVFSGFSESAANTNKGIDIGGKSGQPVTASATGTVLYVGTGIRGYGKLIVIRHNKAYSTVYAHNDTILVKEGQRVVKGQKVAEMGNSDADQVKLHFEIRRLGKPVDPAKFLPDR